MKISNKLITFLFIIILTSIAVISIFGIIMMNDKDIVLQGQIEAEEYNISGLLPGRIDDIFVEKGEKVKKGDTLVKIISSEVLAEYDSQRAMESVAALQSEKIESGTRKQLISMAKELWDAAKADLKLAQNTYDRISALYEDSIVSLQRRDEVEAVYKSALSAERAAYYQYQLSLEGAQRQDKASAKAMAKAAQSNTEVIKALLDDAMLTSPSSGEVADIAFNKGELTSIGTNVMTIIDIDNPYLVVNVREDLLHHFKMNEKILCDIPALKIKDAAFTVNYIAALGSFATWKATKENGGYDMRTFEIQAVPDDKIKDLRPGMSVIITIKQ